MATLQQSLTRATVCALLIGAVVATSAGTADANAAPSAGRNASTPQGHFTPPHQLAASDVVSVAGAPGSAQTLTLRGDQSALQAGTVITSGPGAAAPGGLLVQVRAVRVSGARTVVDVVPASLVDALAPGHYTKTLSLTGGTGTPTVSNPGSPAQPAATNAPVKVPLSKIIPCTGSVKSANITGSLTVNPTVTLDFNIGLDGIIPVVTSASVGASVAQDASLTASIEAAGSCSTNLTLTTLTLPAFWVGPVPITASIGLKLGATVSVQGKATLSGTEHAGGSFGVDYTRGHPITSHNTSSFGWAMQTPTVSGTGKFEVGLTASVGLQIAGILGPQINARGYVGLSADSSASQLNWKLYDGVDITGTLSLHLFGIVDIPIVTIPIWKHEWTLATGVVGAPPSQPRIGVVTSSGEALVNEGGSLGADWVHEYGPSNQYGAVRQVVVSSNRVGVLTSSGVALVKQGGLSAGWTVEYVGATQLALTDSRIGVVTTSGEALVKEGSSLSTGWTDEYGPTYGLPRVRQLALTSNRVGIVTDTGVAVVKEGGLSAAWTTEYVGAAELQLANTRIAVVSESGEAYVKDGGLGAGWTDEYGPNYGLNPVAQIAVSPNRIAIVTSTGSLLAKEGGLSTGWTTVLSGAKQAVVSDNRLGATTLTGGALVNQGPLLAPFSDEHGTIDSGTAIEISIC